ncbi:MAG: histidine kinase [Deltaproteobacteria bacterium GWC2_65_14]|nr:MAG: histidine kinase [Deltaproteobacteria bacterium GWC2_65_14]
MSTEENAALYRRIVEGIPDAVVFADREGIIRLWNGGAEAMFGFRADEALGRSLDLIIPEKMRKRHWEGYYKVMETGVTRYGKELLSVPGIRKDGSRVSLEFSVALIPGDDGSMQGIVAVLRDVTERWMKEKDLKERITLLEKKT